MENNKVKTQKKTTIKNNTNKDLEKELELMRSQLEEMRNLLNIKSTNVKELDSNPNRLIKVISLTPNEMNLSTQPFGQGRIFKFLHFGSTAMIPALDLYDIVNTHLSLIQKGCIYICDDKFIEEKGLQEEYKDILSYDILNNILDMDNDRCQKLLNKCSNDQFNSIFGVVVNKFENGREINSVNVEKIVMIQKEYFKRKGIKLDLEEYISTLQELTYNNKK